jgi:methyl-accepting chemotaxis protein
MDTRGILMSKTPQEVDTYAKGNEARFPQMRKLVADLKQLVPSNERERVAQIEKSVADFITIRSETIRLGREVSTAAADAQSNNDVNRANRKGLNDLLVAFQQAQRGCRQCARR